jgi:formylglycine-generating enzyme
MNRQVDMRDNDYFKPRNHETMYSILPSRIVPLAYFISFLFFWIVSPLTGQDQIKAPNLSTMEEKPSENMILIKGGTFTMGCTSEQESDCYANEKPAHQVTIGDFYLNKYEVTQKQWREVMGSDPPYLNFKGCDQCPVESVSWEDVQMFLSKLNAQTGKKYRLPTEAEWEYAARGGKLSRHYKYSGSNDVDEVAWYANDDLNLTIHPVGQKKANELGLYDMSGNVYEWCQDWDGPYSSNKQTNPKGADLGSFRIYRGGGWNNRKGVKFCRVSYRSSDWSRLGYFNLGFRLAL